MIYKNSIKILFSNFDIVWKNILYYILVFLITGGLCYICINPIYKLLSAGGLVTDFLNVYSDFVSNLNLTALFTSINTLFEKLTDILQNNLSHVWINFVGIGTTLLFFKFILSNLTIMPSCNSLHYYMGSMNKHGYYLSFGETFGRNFRFVLVNFLVMLPLRVLYLGIFILCLKLFKISFVMSIMAIIIIIFGFVLLFSLKYSIFAGWAPTMCVMNYGVFKSLKVSIKNAFRIFPKVFSNSIGIVITIILSNVLIGTFTFLVGLVLTIPASYLLYSIFGMVVVYEGQGMRYYVDVYNVITPKKKEVSDKLKSMKFIV